jgi:hypothetical protein
MSNLFDKSFFTLVDETEIKIAGIDLLMPLKMHREWREFALITAIFSAIAWAVMGWDSTINQLTGEPYGYGTHWTGFVMYPLLYWYVSRYLDHQYRIQKSENQFMSLGITALAVGVFEFIWLWGYANGQGQWWVWTLQLPQGKVVQRNFSMVLAGLLSFLYLWHDRTLDPNFDELTASMTLLALASLILWYKWPFPIETFTVYTEYGIFKPTQVFPQTLYTIRVLKDSAAGVAYFVQDDMIHLVNVLAKAFVTLTVAAMARVKYK